MGAKFRGSVVQGTLATMRAHPAGAGMLARVPPSTLATIESSTRTTWIDCDALATLCEAFEDEAGVDEHIALHRKGLVESAQSPLFLPLLQGAMRMFGNGPSRLFWLYPKALGLASRDFARVQVARTDGAVRLQFYEIDDRFRRPFWPHAITGVFQGVLDVSGTRGRVTINEGELDSGNMECHVSWLAETSAEPPQAAR